MLARTHRNKAETKENAPTTCAIAIIKTPHQINVWIGYELKWRYFVKKMAYFIVPSRPDESFQ